MERRLLWRRWLAVVAAGELVGFTVPALVGVLVRDATSVVQLVALPVAGLVEGAALGLAQASVLSRAWPAFNPRPWVVATSLAAALAWFLGMLPSTTHATWSSWPVPWVVIAAAVLGAILLATIGTAQAWALPRGTRGRPAWVGWTALGWCAGLTVFTVVTTPWWQPGQSLPLVLLIGVVGGVAMAVAMAAVTGIGAVRLVTRARGEGHRAPFAPGRHLLSTLIGTPVYDASGHRAGAVSDLVVDLGAGSERPPVTHLVVGRRGGGPSMSPWIDVVVPTGADGLVIAQDPDSGATSLPGPTALLLRQDVLDSPVVTAAPPRRSRVSDVVVEIGVDGAHVTGLDLSTTGLAHRILRRATSVDSVATLPLSRVHLLTDAGHAAQLAAPAPMVLGLPAGEVAEVLTRVPVGHAREIMRRVDEDIRDHAVRLLHPHVRARVTGAGSPLRRTRRLAGWRLHRPNARRPTGGRR